MARLALAFCALLFLAACATGPNAAGSGDVAAMATRAAYLSSSLGETAEAVVATATGQAVAMTRQAEQGATATAAIYEATVQAAAAQSTANAISAEGTRSVYAANATATVEAAAARGTAQAIDRVAQVESELANGEIQRVRIANQRTLSEMRIKELAAWTLASVMVIAAFAGLAYVVITTYSGAQTIPSGAWAESRPNTAAVIAKDRQHGWTVLHREPATLPPSRPEALPGPEQQNDSASLPAVVELPEHLPAGRIALGLTPRRSLSYSQKELGDILGAGMKGSGKSSLVRSLAYQAWLQGWRVFLADAEGLTFEPAVWGRVATSSADVEGMLASVLEEFDRRLDQYRRAFDMVRRELSEDEQFFVEDLDAYNQAADRFNLEPMPPMMLAWDEANNHLGESRALDEAVHELLRRSRKPGMTVAIFGHTWHASQVSSAIFTNLTRRIALRCEERTSRVVIGDDSAARLPRQPGYAVMRENGAVGQIKTYYLPAARILRDVNPERSPAWNRPADVGGIQAEIDANSLAGRPLRSRRQVALALTGLDNGEAYIRADAALEVLARRGETWAAELLQGSTSTAEIPAEAVR